MPKTYTIAGNCSINNIPSGTHPKTEKLETGLDSGLQQDVRRKIRRGFGLRFSAVKLKLTKAAAMEGRGSKLFD